MKIPVNMETLLNTALLLRVGITLPPLKVGTALPQRSGLVLLPLRSRKRPHPRPTSLIPLLPMVPETVIGVVLATMTVLIVGHFTKFPLFLI